MSSMYLVDGKPLMCEKCEKYPAKYTMAGIIPNYLAICPRCAGDVCSNHGDTLGADKFYTFAQEWENAYEETIKQAQAVA